MSSYRLMFPGVRCSMMFSGFGLKPPACGFQSYFYSTIDKTSRLKMKCFSTVRDTQRGSELHGEEKREEGVRGDPNEMKWNQKRREQVSQ